MYVELEISSHDILINQIPTGNNPTIIEFFLNNYIKLNWKGNWAAGQYNVNDVIRYNQATWVANKNTTQTPSQISTDWGLMVVDGLDGVGVTNIDLIETIDLVDYYRMYFSDGSHFDYSLKNGEKGDIGTGIDDISSDNSITGKHIIRITLTNGSWYEFTVLDGIDGYTPIKGVDYFDGITPTIGENKHWYIGAIDTGIIAEGQDGVTPIITIGENENWYINGVDSGKPSRGANGTSAYEIYVVGGGTLSEVDFNESITDIPVHIRDETIHHTIEALNLLYSAINHNHNLNDLTEKSYNSLTNKPDLSSLHTHANKEDLDNYDPDNFEPANANIQEHIADTNIHIDSSSELGEDINESTHSLLLWNGLKALKVTFARLKTWIGSLYFAFGGNTFGVKKTIGSIDNQDFGIIANNTERVTILKNGNVGIGTTNPAEKLSIKDAGTIAGNGFPLGVHADDELVYMAGFFNDRKSSTIPGLAYFGWDNGDVNIGTFNGKFFLGAGGTVSSGAAIRMTIDNLSGNVGIYTSTPKSKLQVNGGIQCGDDTAAASADKVGTIRQRDVDNKTKLEFVRNNNGTYGWEQINDKLSLDQTTPQTVLGLLQNQSTAAMESAPLSAELLTSSGWSSSDWTGDFVNGFTHTTGNTTPLTNTLAALNNTLYQITWVITNRTAGSVNITFGGVSTGAVTASGNIGNKTASTGTLSIAPTTDFNGTIVISIKRITGTYAPTYQILDSTGVSNIEIRSSLNTLNNTFIGKGAGIYNTTGSYNSAQGRNALQNNTTGYYNSAQGAYALFANTTGFQNSAQGVQALQYNTTGFQNSAQGAYALFANTTGFQNSAQGVQALQYNTTGFQNSAQGVQALQYNTTGSYNSAQGYAALLNNTTGYYNSAQGAYALFANTTGSQNSAQGAYALLANTTGFQNSAQGAYALFANTTGFQNSAQGVSAGRYLADGVTANQTSNNSVFLGYNTKSKQASQTNEIVIGANAIGNGSNTVTLGNTSVTDTYLRGLVHLNNGIQIGDNTAAASEALKGVVRYRENAGGSFYEMCMKGTDGVYRWTSIVTIQ